jgi:fatty acid desaturase
MNPAVSRLPNPTRRSHGGLTVAVTFASAALAILAAARAPSAAAFILAELALALVILRSFCLVHELSHGTLVRDRRLSDALGVVASIICLLPYFPWKRVHIEHHTWAGWIAKDPTEDDIEFSELDPVEQWLGTWAWRLSIPLLGLAFSLRTFWNLKRLGKLFPSRRDRASFALSVGVIVLAHGAAAYVFGGLYARVFLTGLAIYLFMLDPLMLSQHVGIPLLEDQSGEPRPVRAREQERFARTLIFPVWFARHVLLGFNYHSAHHARPTVAGQLLDSMPFEPSHEENWLTWLLRAKATPLGVLLERDEKVPEARHVPI